MDVSKLKQINRIITSHNDACPCHYRNKFKFYSITKKCFENLPEDQFLILVSWKGLSIKELTWISGEEITKNLLIDPLMLYRTFKRDYFMNSVLYPPNLSTMVPSKDLVPQKIVKSVYDDNQNKIFVVKWRSNGITYLSYEKLNFFEQEETEILYKQYNNQVEIFKSIGNYVNPFFEEKETTLNKNYSQIFEYLKTSNVVVNNGLNKTHTLDNIIKFELLKRFGKLMDYGIKGPHLIITNPENIEFYEENINKAIPNALVTFITEIPSKTTQIKLLEDELYDKNSLLKCNFVITTQPNYNFRRNNRFDVVIIDRKLTTCLKSKSLTIKRNSCLIIHNGIRNPLFLRKKVSSHSNQQIKHIEFSIGQPKVKHINCFIELYPNQMKSLDSLKQFLKTQPSKIKLITTEMKKYAVCTDFFKNPLETGKKFVFIDHIIQILKLLKMKVVVLADGCWFFDSIAKKYDANILDWGSSSLKSKAICELFASLTPQKASQIINFYNEKGFHLLSNHNVIFVDCNCNTSFVSLKCTDAVIDLRCDYSPFLLNSDRNKFGIAVNKTTLYFDLIGKRTIDEITTAMNAMEPIFNEDEINSMYFNIFTKSLFNFGVEGDKISHTTESFSHMIEKYMKTNDLLKVIDFTDSQISVIENFSKLGTVYPPQPIPQKKIVEKDVEIIGDIPLIIPESYEKKELSKQIEDNSKIIEDKELKEIKEIKEDEDKETKEIKEIKKNKEENHHGKLTLNMDDKTQILFESIRKMAICHGSNVSLWKVDFEQFTPLSLDMIQEIVQKIEEMEEGKPKEEIEKMNMFCKAFDYLVVKKILLPFPSCKLKYWDSSCDVTLLKLIIDNGLNVPELYLNDLVIMGVLGLAGLETEKQKCDFLLERIETMYNCYSNYHFN